MFFEQFNLLCVENGTTPTRFTIDILKLSSSKVTAWKNGSIPKIEILQKIASYFNVSVGYLFDGKKNSSSSELSENEQKIIDIFKSLTETQQGQLIGRAEMLAEMNEEVYRQEDIG